MFGSIKSSAPKKRQEEEKTMEKSRSFSTPTLTSSSLSDQTDELFKEYGISSPPKGKSSLLTGEAALRKIKKDNYFSWETLTADQKTALLYLYGREYFNHIKPKRRKKKLKNILHDLDSLKRSLTLIKSTEGDLRFLHGEDENRRAYARITAVPHHYFKQADSFGFLECMHLLQWYLRRQLSGNCYLQAPSVGFSYLLQKRGLNLPPVDITKYVRHVYDDEQLEKYIVEDSGGDSAKVLDSMVRGIAKNDGWRVDVGDSSSARDIRVLPPSFVKEKLASLGPGVVVGFRVDEHFERACNARVNDETVGYLSFDAKSRKSEPSVTFVAVPTSECEESIEAIHQNGKTTIGNETCASREFGSMSEAEAEVHSISDSVHTSAEPRQLFPSHVPAQDHTSVNGCDGHKNTNEYHAMLLVGGRPDEKIPNKTWLLLQNWWKGSQFIEVSDQYFENCRAQVVFAREDLELRNDIECFPVELNDATIAECNGLDRAYVNDPILDR